jgi:hypothetical protein
MLDVLRSKKQRSPFTSLTSRWQQARRQIRKARAEMFHAESDLLTVVRCQHLYDLLHSLFKDFHATALAMERARLKNG